MPKIAVVIVNGPIRDLEYRGDAYQMLSAPFGICLSDHEEHSTVTIYPGTYPMSIEEVEEEKS